MAMYGFGTYYIGEGDVTELFLKSSVACIGYKEADMPELHQLLSEIKIGDWVYLKAYPAAKRQITAIGVVLESSKDFGIKFGYGVEVKWLANYKNLKLLNQEKFPVGRGALYLEKNIGIQKRLLDLVFNR